MINLGLSTTEQKQFNSLLVNSHDIFIRIQLMDINHNMLGDFSTRLVDGQVDVDSDADVSRSAKLTLIDPDHRLHLDSGAPADGALYLDRMIRIIYVIISPDAKTQFSVPVFTGPITKIDRDGILVNLECQGKESLSLANMWRGKTYKKGHQKISVIRSILSDIAGEKKVSISSNATAKLPSNLALTKDSIPWKTIESLANSLNLQSFYDGRGIATIRRRPSKTAWTFRQNGVNSTLSTEPQWGYDSSALINAAAVSGATPKAKGKAKGTKGGKDSKKKEKPKGAFHFSYIAPRSHPLSPYGLKRGGVPQFRPAYVDDSNLRSNAECRKVAIRVVNNGLLQSIDVAFDALLIPHLEEGDVCRLVSDDFTGSFLIRKFSIPLTPGLMSVGYHKNLKPRKAHIRHKRRS